MSPFVIGEEGASVVRVGVYYTKDDTEMEIALSRYDPRWVLWWIYIESGYAWDAEA